MPKQHKLGDIGIQNENSHHEANVKGTGISERVGEGEIPSRVEIASHCGVKELTESEESPGRHRKEARL